MRDDRKFNCQIQFKDTLVGERFSHIDGGMRYRFKIDTRLQNEQKIKHYECYAENYIFNWAGLAETF